MSMLKLPHSSRWCQEPMSQLPNRISQKSPPRTSACFSTKEMRKCTYLHSSIGDADTENRVLDTVGERKCGMIWESNIEMCMRECTLSPFGHVHLFATQWTACQAPLSLGFSRQEYWSRLPCPPPRHLSNPGIEPMSLNVSCIGRRVIHH